jgi:hypothetical protein
MTMADRHDEASTAVIRWALAKPVLARLLATAAAEDEGELIRAVVDLMDPQRSRLWSDCLKATGASLPDTDALWYKLGGITGLYGVDWERVGRELTITQFVKEGEM